MAKRIVRTTQERIYSATGKPVETVQAREVVRTVREPEGMKVYDPGTALPERYRFSAATISPDEDRLTEVATRVRAQESWMRTQSGVLRDIDYRLIRLEEGNRAWTAVRSFEQNTWWTLWGVLMLIVGSALAITLILIFTAAVH